MQKEFDDFDTQIQCEEFYSQEEAMYDLMKEFAEELAND